MEPQMKSQLNLAMGVAAAMAFLALPYGLHAADNTTVKPAPKPAAAARPASPPAAAHRPAPAVRAAQPPARAVQQQAVQQRKPDAAATARAQQLQMNRRMEAEGAALRTRQA